MDRLEDRVPGNQFEKCGPLFPCVIVDPFSPVEGVQPLEESVHLNDIVADDHVFACGCLRVWSTELSSVEEFKLEAVQLRNVRHPPHNVPIIVHDLLVSLLLDRLVLTTEREDEDDERQSNNRRLNDGTQNNRICDS